MPSTLVHVALGAVIATALLGELFSRKSLLVVLGAAAFPDLDTFLGLLIDGGHRALLHTLLLPVVLGALLVFDLRIRARSVLRARWGRRGVRVAWVSFAALTLAGIGPDLFSNGVNVFYPVYDQFYRIDGRLLISEQKGIIQSFVELSPPSDSGESVVGESVGSTNDTHYRTGVDPSAGAEQGNVEANIRGSPEWHGTARGAAGRAAGDDATVRV